MDLYKIVGPNGECLNGGHGSWSLPDGDTPGEWWEVAGTIEPCRNGLHLATADQLPDWLPGVGDYVIYRAEYEGEPIDGGGKMVVGKARLLPRLRPMPDLAAARDRRAAARLHADDRYQRAERRARKLLDVTIPARWQSYLAAIGSARLPVGHPGARYQDALRAARAAYDAVVGPVMRNRDAANARADAAYSAAVREGIMPE